MPKPLSTTELAETLERLSRKVGDCAGDIPNAMIQGAAALRRQAEIIEGLSAKCPTVTLLFGKDGRPTQTPQIIEATVAWYANENIAHAIDLQGRLVASLHNARIDWIMPNGFRMSGMESIDATATSFRVQAWQVRQSITPA